MTIALVHKHFDAAHLEEVKNTMQTLGAPEIKAVYVECMDMFVALEGCHRIRAAKALGLVPVIVEMDFDAIASMDVTDPALGLDIDMPGTTVEDMIADCNKWATIIF
jgi:hypothetical protein